MNAAPVFHRFGSPVRRRSTVRAIATVATPPEQLQGFAVAEQSPAGKAYRARLRGLTEEVILRAADPRVEPSTFQ